MTLSMVGLSALSLTFSTSELPKKGAIYQLDTAREWLTHKTAMCLTHTRQKGYKSEEERWLNLSQVEEENKSGFSSRSSPICNKPNGQRNLQVLISSQSILIWRAPLVTLLRSKVFIVLFPGHNGKIRMFTRHRSDAFGLTPCQFSNGMHCFNFSLTFVGNISPLALTSAFLWSSPFIVTHFFRLSRWNLIYFFFSHDKTYCFLLSLIHWCYRRGNTSVKLLHYSRLPTFSNNAHIHFSVWQPLKTKKQGELSTRLP